MGALLPSLLACLVLMLLAAGSVPAAPAAGPSEDEARKMAEAAPAKAAARPRRPRRLLIFSGNQGFVHTAIPYGARAVEVLGAKTGAFQVTHSDDTAIFSAEGLKPFDAVFLNNGYGFILGPEARRALDGFVKASKGLAGIHAASANFKGWPEGTALFGALFRNHPWGPSAEWAIRNEDPGHPLNVAFGGKGFRVRDEIYAFSDFNREREHVLLSLDLFDPRTAQEPHTDTCVPISWVHPYGKGRVFFCSLGHQHDLFWNPAYLRHLLDGIQFALGDLDADTRPNPAPEVVSAEAIEGALRALLGEEPGGSLLPAQTLHRAIADAGGNRVKRADLEHRFVAALGRQGTPGGKRLLCEFLSRVAGPASVPAVSPLLMDSALEHAARTVLERVATPEAAAALRSAMPQVPAALKLGIVASLGVLRDRQAVGPLAEVAASADPAVAGVALRALGRIASREAGQALLRLQVAPDLQPALDEAQAECAERLAAEGATAAAQPLYLALAREGRAARARAMGLAGLAATGHPRTAQAVLAAVSDVDPTLQRRALQLAARLRDLVAARRLDALYPSLSPAMQRVFLTSLAEGGDPSAIRIAIPALASEDTGLRGAAIRAVGRLGGTDAVTPLLQVAGRLQGAEKQMALGALIRLPGEGVDGELIRRAREGAPEIRAVAMGVLAERGVSAAVPALLEAAGAGESVVALPALRALAPLARASEQKPLLDLLLQAGDEEIREAACDALVAVTRRLGAPDSAIRPVIAAFSRAAPERKPMLIGVLAEVGGARALAEITRTAGAAEPEVRRAAIRALAETWDDPRPLPTLLAIAKGEHDRVLKVQALRGYLRLVEQMAAAQPHEAVARVSEALSAAARPEEKRQALGVLRACRVPEAVALAARCLDEPDLLGDAAETVLALAAPQDKEGVSLAPVRGQSTQAALEKARDLAKDQGMRERAQALLDAYLTDPWESRDVGAVGRAGSARCSSGTFTIEASGADVWGPVDAFHFVFRPLVGDGSLVARVVSLENTNPWAKAGVMMRDSAAPDAPYVFMCVSPVNGDAFQQRPAAGAEATYTPSGAHPAPPCWVKLSRARGKVAGFISADGQQWRQVGEVAAELAKGALVGLAVTSHQEGTLTRAVIDGVAVNQP